MITFMLSVLGSLLFWGVYLLITLFVGTFILKTFFKESYNLIIGEESFEWKKMECGAFSYDMLPLMGAFIAYLFWPLFILFYIFKFIVRIMIFGMRNVIILVDKLTPEITIKSKSEEKT